MTGRFTTNGYKIYDTFHDGEHWLVNTVEAEEIVGVMNNLDNKARERSKALSKLQKENDDLKAFIRGLTAGNGEIRLADGNVYRVKRKFQGEGVNEKIK